MTSLRGKNLHPEMARRILSLYNTEHYEDAVLAAFKVIETRLRDITEMSDADLMQVLKETFNPATGRLQDPKAWQSEREGRYLLFRSAFLSFRNRRAHIFVDTDGEEAFDLIVLANRMLLMIEEGQQFTQEQPTTTPEETTAYLDLSRLLDYFWKASLGVYGDEIYERKPIIIDADNDGEPELLIPGGLLTSNRERGEAFRVFKNTGKTVQQIEVEEGDYSFPANDILLADVDNDGHQEVVCTTRVGVGYNNILLVYKYRNGRYEVLKKDPQAATGVQEGFAFFNAHVGDIDDDGQVEVVSESKLSGVRKKEFSSSSMRRS
jgi:uncharacterized protein (TIGR02391 family)